MKFKKPYLYLCGALLLFILVWILEKPTAPEKGDLLDLPVAADLDPSAVAAIEIEHLFNGTRLERKEGDWKVASLPSDLKKSYDTKVREEEKKPPVEEPPPQWEDADDGRVSLKLDILQDTRLISLVGENPERHGYFEVNKAGMQIRLYDEAGKLLFHLYAGKSGPLLMQGYLRREGENAVYLADRDLRQAFPAKAEGWRAPPPPAEPSPQAP